MKNVFFLIVSLFISNLIFAQTGSWNKITGKNEFTDSLKFDKPRNNPAEDSVLTLDYNTRKLKFTLKPGAGPANPCQSHKVIGETIWDSLLVFHNTLYDYYIGCNHYTASPTTVTLAPAFVANPRTDIFIVDTFGVFSVLTGGISGLAPQPDPASQLQVAQATVLAGDTIPTGIFNRSIYKENVEWVGATNIPGGLFNYTQNPYAGLVSTYIPSFTNLQYITYQDMALDNSHDITEVSFLKMYIRLNAPMTSGNLNFTFFNGLAAITTSVTLVNGQYGFNNNLVDSYQLIAIPISAWQLTGQGFNFNTLQIIVTGAGDSFQLDNIILQSGGGGTGGTGVNTFQGEDGSPPRNGNVIFRNTDDIHAINRISLNGDTTFYYTYNSLGQLLDSFWIARSPLFGQSPITITDTPTVRFGNGVRGYIIGISGSPIFGTPRWSVRDSVSIPPVTPLDGSTFLVGTSPSGSFTGHANQIATYDSASVSYSFQSATVGDLLYDAANTMVSQWTGTAWVWVGHLVLYQGGNRFGQPYVFGSLDYNPIELKSNSVRAASIGDSTTQNTSLGFGALRYLPLQKNSSFGVSEGITAIGFKALQNNTTGSYSTGIGRNALGNTTTGGNLTAVGVNALFANTTGTNSTAVGYGAAQGNVSGVDLTVMGYMALSGNNSGQGIVAIGNNALQNNTTGQLHLAAGIDALKSNTTGSNSTALGRASLTNNLTGSSLTGVGINSLFSNTTGDNSTGVGASAGFYNTTGANNTFIGYQAGAYILGGGLTNDIANNSIFIGGNSRALANNQTNQIVICQNCTGLGSNTTLLGDSSTTLTQIMGAQKLPSYGSGTHTGTATYTLQVDASGNVIEGTGGGGGGGGLANFYLKDSSFSSDRIADLDGHNLEFKNTGGAEFSIGGNIANISTASGKQIEIDEGDDIVRIQYDPSNRIQLTNTGTAITGNLTLNTVPNGLSTDSVLTRDASTGIVNMRDAGSFGSTLQQAFDKAPSAPQIDAATNDFIITNAASFENVTTADPTGQGDFGFGYNYSFLSNTQDTTRVGFTNLLTDNSPTNDTRLNLYTSKTTSGTVTSGYALTITTEYLKVSGGSTDGKKTKVIIESPDTLLTTPTYIWAASGDTLKKFAYSAGGGGTVTSVARTNGLGITASVANPTTTPNITIAVDTSDASILSRQRAAATYAPISGGANYILNQTSLQSSSNYNISGTGIVGTKLRVATTTDSSWGYSPNVITAIETVNGALFASNSLGEHTLINAYTGSLASNNINKANVLRLQNYNTNGSSAVRFVDYRGWERAASGFQQGTSGFYLSNAAFLSATNIDSAGNGQNFAPPRLILGQEGNNKSQARYLADTLWNQYFLDYNNDTAVHIPALPTTAIAGEYYPLQLIQSRSANFGLMIQNRSTGATPTAQITLRTGATTTGFLGSYGANWTYAGYPVSGIAVGSGTGNVQLMAVGSTGKIKLFTGSDALVNERMQIDNTGKVTIGSTTLTSLLNVGSSAQFQVNSSGNIVAIGAGTTSVAPINLTSGTNKTSATAGAIEYDAIELYETNSTAVRGTVEVMRGQTSSAGTLTLAYTYTDYIFGGTISTWTAPAVVANYHHSFYLKNAGSGIITLNSSAGGNDFYTTTLTNTVAIAAGSAIILRLVGSVFYVE